MNLFLRAIGLFNDALYTQPGDLFQSLDDEAQQRSDTHAASAVMQSSGKDLPALASRTLLNAHYPPLFLRRGIDRQKS